MSAPEPQVTTAAIDVLYDYLWEPDDATSREECAQVVVDILRASNVIPAEALRALIALWRAEEHHTGTVAGAYAAGRIDCADELERAMEGDHG